VVVLVLSVGFIVSVVALHSEFGGLVGLGPLLIRCSHCEGHQEILGACCQACVEGECRADGWRAEDEAMPPSVVRCVIKIWELEDASGAIGLGKVLYHIYALSENRRTCGFPMRRAF
jgi:hypothetical protein